MPSLASYVRLAPFSIDELVDAANSVLRDRHRLNVARRTVRYYVTERVLPPPGGSPKFARYGVDHLLRLVGTRCLIDLGRSLEDCRVELDRLLSRGNKEAILEVQRLVDGPAQSTEEPENVMMESLLRAAGEPPMERVADPPRPYGEGLVLRTTLGPGFVLESPGDLPREDALQRASRLIKRALRSI